MQQSFANLIFEGLVSPFKIGNMVWFCHDISRFRGCNGLKKEGKPSAVWGTTRERPLNCASKKPKLLTQQASPTRVASKTGNGRSVFDLDQTAALPLFPMLHEGFSHGASKAWLSSWR
jgi:hypothetical protein